MKKKIQEKQFQKVKFFKNSQQEFPFFSPFHLHIVNSWLFFWIMFNLKDTPLKNSRRKLFISLSFATETRARESKYKWNLNIWIWKQFSSQLSFPSLLLFFISIFMTCSNAKKKRWKMWRHEKTLKLEKEKSTIWVGISFSSENLFIKFTV